MRRTLNAAGGIIVLILASCTSIIGEEQLQATIEAAVKTAVAAIDTPSPPPAVAADVRPLTKADLKEAVAAALLDVTSGNAPTPTPTRTSPTQIPPTQTPTETPTPRPPEPTVATKPPTATSTPTPTPEAIITSFRPGNLMDLRQFMLDMINTERTDRGLSPVLLGDNEAAQEHAEEMMAVGYLSHWNIKGEKPFMRYARAGGFNYSAENVSGVDYYVQPCRTTFCVRDPFELLEESMQGLMDSAGHRRNILDPWHTHVNLGIAYNGRVDSVSQQFENKYVKRFFELPHFEDKNNLVFAGEMSEGWEFRSARLQYDPELKDLTIGQLGATYCSMSGYPLAAFRRPPGRNAFYSTDNTIVQYAVCTDPYRVEPARPAPTNGSPKDVIRTIAYTDVQIPWITAKTWIVGGEDFEVRVDVEEILRINGPGIYSVLIWAENQNDDAVVVSEYPVAFNWN